MKKVWLLLILIGSIGCATKGPLRLNVTNVGQGVTRYENSEIICYEFIDLGQSIIKCYFKSNGSPFTGTFPNEREF